MNDVKEIIEYVDRAFDRTPYCSRWFDENGNESSCDVGYAAEWWFDLMKPELMRVFEKE